MDGEPNPNTCIMLHPDVTHGPSTLQCALVTHVITQELTFFFFLFSNAGIIMLILKYDCGTDEAYFLFLFFSYFLLFFFPPASFCSRCVQLREARVAVWHLVALHGPSGL